MCVEIKPVHMTSDEASFCLFLFWVFILVFISSVPSGQCQTECHWTQRFQCNTSSAEPLAVTGRVGVSGNCHILYIWKLSTGLRTVSLHVWSLSEEHKRNIPIQWYSFCVTDLFRCCLLNCRIESRMSKSVASQRSPSMVTESSKAVTSAAVDTASGSKVSFTSLRVQLVMSTMFCLRWLLLL